MAPKEIGSATRRTFAVLVLLVGLLVTSSTVTVAGAAASSGAGSAQSDIGVHNPAVDTSSVGTVECGVFNAEIARLQLENRQGLAEYERLTAELAAAEPKPDPDIPPFDWIRILEEIRKPYLDRLVEIRDDGVDRTLRILALSRARDACVAGTAIDPDTRAAAVEALEASVADLDAQIDEWERLVDYGNVQQCSYQRGRQTDMGLTCPPRSWHVDGSGSDAEQWVQVSERRTDDGLYAVTYENPDRSVRVVVYEGSVPLVDVFNPRWFKHWIVDNFWGGLTGTSDQTTQAMDYSVEMRNQLAPGQELVMVGHSRGCKHASAGARATGSRAVCFNGAGLPERTVPKYLRDRGYSEQEIRVLRAQSEITSLSADIDPLTRLQERFPPTRRIMPDVPGKHTVLETPPDTALSGHGMELVLQVEKERASEIDEYRSTLQSTIDELAAGD